MDTRLKLWLKKYFPRLIEPLATIADIYRKAEAERKLFFELKKIYDHFPTVEFHAGAYVDMTCDLGENVVIWDGTHLHHCSVGRYTYFAPHSRFSDCRIGAFCSIGPEVRAGLGIHPSRNFVSTHPSFFSCLDNCRGHFTSTQKFVETRTIEIGNDVWIGARAIILDGITIGNGAIIGAGAVVTHDVDAYTIAAGVPARPIQKRFPEDQIDFLCNLSWWDKDIEWIRTHADLFDNIHNLKAVLTTEIPKYPETRMLHAKADPTR